MTNESLEYSRSDVERIVAKRIKAQSTLVRGQATLKRQLKEVVLRLDAANHLREVLVTKEEFQVGLDDLRADIDVKLKNVVSVEVLEGNEIWVATAEQRKALIALADEELADARRSEVRQRWHETLWARVGIVSGALLALMAAAQIVITLIQVWRHGL